MDLIGKVSFGIIAIIVSALLGGFTFMKLYEWFVCYAFSVQPLNFVESIGIVFFIGFLKVKSTDTVKDSTWEEFLASFLTKLLYLFLALGIGYLITVFQ